MKTVLLAILALLALAVLVLLGWRQLDHRADRREMDRLRALQPSAPARFDPAMVADLPEPARRYFGFAIAPGTPLWPVAEIEMAGQFGLGTAEAPGYRPMQARQVLAVPEGFVWKMRTRGGLPISGSDSGGWTRFWLLGAIPVARAGGDADHARSAFGRYAGEASIWAPAALLPQRGVTWEAVGTDVARFRVTRGGLEQAVDLTVDAEGRPVRAVFQRWGRADSGEPYHLRPFGAEMSDFREVDGYRLPFHVEAGNLYGTRDYFPFFIADVTAIRFPGAPR